MTAATAEERSEALRVRRYQGRKVLNRVSQIDACKGCGRRVLDPATGVIYGHSSRGYVVTIGLVRCGKIWFCPQCSASIRRGRTEELTTAALRWLAAGGTLAVVVLTARHNRTTELARLSDALWGAPLIDAKGAPVLDRSGKPRRAPGAYQTMLTAPTFYGRPESVSTWTRKNGTVGTSVRPAEDGIRHRIGYAGMARASEVTRSWENGWHPHMNLLVFLGAHMNGTPAKGTVREYFEPGADSLEEWEDWLRGLWASTLRKADPTFEPSTECERHGCKCGGKGHGVTVQLVKSPDDKALIEYLTKVQDGKAAPASVDQDVKAAKGAALEVARGDNKSGRRESMTPFQMLYRLYDLEVSGLGLEDAEGYGTGEQCRAWWAEYESAMAGRRAIEWTRGLRGHVGLKGDDSEEQDLEYVYDPDMQAALTGGVILTEAAVTAVVRGDAELDVEACVRAEAYDSVGDLVEALGGYRAHVRMVTPEQLVETQENLFARVLARREERARQERIEAYELQKTVAEREAETAKQRQRLAGLFAGLLARRS
ncbi:replication protein [Streptomyces sp. SP17BM10]|uniref:replication protein n=1 Tax=Streptomyces sp. SP17BM10 TaxID=3002530 RepID=UPI002E7603EB|nr:replication protein [Streptomyces sp. SP17BM10]MEE1783898.1 replication protein [Streptomyces sp. SP17BM10]